MYFVRNRQQRRRPNSLTEAVRWRQLPLQFGGVVLILAMLVGCSPVMLDGEETVPPPPTPSVSLHMAALQGDADAVRQHIAAGSDLDAVDAYGSTPLLVAATFGKREVAEALLAGGADTTIRDAEGSTALHVAALFGYPEIVAALLENGADPSLRNSNGSTAFDIVAAPFEHDRWLYDQLGAALAPLGLELDYAQIAAARPLIGEMLRPTPDQLATVDYTPLPGADWPVAAPADVGLQPAQVAELYYDAAQLETIYGLLVLKDGQLVGERYFNGGAVDKQARLQSVTKSFTAALVGLALEQGCLTDVDQTMMPFFPEFAGQNDDPRKEQITLQQLLQMRAGYPWEESTQELFEILYHGFEPALLVEFPLVSDPGMHFEYSNLSSHLLGIIVTRACNADLRSFAQEHLFTPLGIEAGLWIQDWKGYYNGHADLHLTVRDVAKFGQMVLDEGGYRGEQVIPADWARESLQLHSDRAWVLEEEQNWVGRYFRELGYGYQFWSATVGDRNFDFAWGHGGQIVALLDELDMVIVVISDPMFGQHDDQAWKHEQANFNLVGKFIDSLPAE